MGAVIAVCVCVGAREGWERRLVGEVTGGRRVERQGVVVIMVTLSLGKWMGREC